MTMNAEFFSTNRAHFGDLLANNSTAVLFSGWAIVRSEDEDYPFSVNNNFYYLTGITEPEVTLMISKDDTGHLSEKLFINEVNPLKEKWIGHKIRKDEATKCSGIEDVYYHKEWESVCDGVTCSVLYYDATIPDHQYDDAQTLLDEIIAEERQDLSQLLAQLRMIKQPQEIEAIKTAIAMTAQGIEFLQKNLHPGMMEYEAQAAFEYAIKLTGAQETAFETIVASGVHGPTLHYVSNDDKIGNNTLVLLDLGARHQRYCGDISRTLFVGDTISHDQLAIYESVLSAQKRLISLYKPGTPMTEIQQATKDYLKEELVARGILNENDAIDEYYYHGIGHSLGLDTHDVSPAGRAFTLEPGMIVTCEPGLYFADKGIGVRIEDDILVTKDDPVNLSADIPKSLPDTLRKA